MRYLPGEIIDIIVDYSIERVEKDPDKPHEFFIIYHNVNPWRAISKEYLLKYPKNPYPAVFQPPVCVIS